MISFFVAGTPAPKGSTKAFYIKALGRAVITADNKETQKAWCSIVSYTAAKVIKAPIEGPVVVETTFYFNRPKSVKKSRIFPTVKPDLDKLVRATWDALTGIAFKDDAQVCSTAAWKLYAKPDEPTGCHIQIYPTEKQEEASA